MAAVALPARIDPVIARAAIQKVDAPTTGERVVQVIYQSGDIKRANGRGNTHKAILGSRYTRRPTPDARNFPMRFDLRSGQSVLIESIFHIFRYFAPFTI